LLPEYNQLRLLFIDDRLEQFGNNQWLYSTGSFDLNATVSAKCQSGANLFLTAFISYRDGDDLCCDTGFLEAHSFLYGYFTKGVDGHFDVIKVNVSTIGFSADLDVVVNNTLNGNKNLHGFSIDFSGGFGGRSNRHSFPLFS
jgi:hypothetical protein